MRIIFTDNGVSNVSISKIQAPSNITVVMPGMYVACIYDDDWFVENVIEASEQHNEIHVKFMKNSGTCFLRRTKYDKCWVSLCNFSGHAEFVLVQENCALTYAISNVDSENPKFLKTIS